MKKLLIYIGEDQKFDIDTTISNIMSLKGVSNAKKGNFVGAIFECEYESNGRNTIVRMSPEAETITAEGLGDESLEFALELQKSSSVPLHAIDLDYNFNVDLRDFNSVTELKNAISF